jgi:hypothetical protein
MDKVQILLVINSIVLSFLSILFVIVGYFLKDLHRDFKTMVERVNTLYNEHTTHVILSNSFDKNIQNRVSGLFRKIKKLEHARAEKNSTDEHK